VELEDGELLGYVSIHDSADVHKDAAAMADKMKRKAGKQGKLKSLDVKVRRHSLGSGLTCT
jgi:hypothetical protein